MHPLLESVEQASKVHAGWRRTGRASAVETIRLLEAAIVEALAGERLRNLPNLGKSEAFFGVRVRGTSFAPLPPGRPCLIVDDSGMLMMATRGSPCNSVAATDEDLKAEDVEPYANLMEAVLTMHLVGTKRSTERYRRCGKVAETLRQSLGALNKELA
jgi:hypothetical protein